MRKKEHLPLLGVGPFYVVSIVAATALVIVFRHNKYVRLGYQPQLKPLFFFCAFIFIMLGLYLWTRAVLVDKLSKSIRNDFLLTSGVYSVVRNPIYTAFLCVTSGILCLLSNFYYLLLPLVYWLLLTILMRLTEEKWLREKYGAAYLDYCQKVNRCWPKPWQLFLELCNFISQQK